jgi:quercetin dioxygenase-like cupin family protein
MSARALAAVLPTAPDAVAPDGSEVRLLLASDRASAAHFRLAAGATSVAVRHRTVDEIWYVVEGDGEMWLADGDTCRRSSCDPGCACRSRAGPCSSSAPPDRNHSPRSA